MIEFRASHERGHFDFGWLETYHSFSFGEYYDPVHVQFGPLRVLNEDFIKPGEGFPTHPHRDMEIVTYVLSGSLAHKDSTGGEGVIRAGEVQRMSAGTGIRHSEYNASRTEPVHLLQVWFLPERRGIPAGYEQKRLEPDSANRLVAPVVRRPGANQLAIHQDVLFHVCRLESGRQVTAEISKGRIGYLHNTMIGKLEVNGGAVGPGDGLKITGPERLDVLARQDSNFVLFDMTSIPGAA